MPEEKDKRYEEILRVFDRFCVELKLNYGVAAHLTRTYFVERSRVRDLAVVRELKKVIEGLK